MPTPFEKLSALLKELFQLDQADLDFGIYHIMNQKRGEITQFLNHDLLPQVKTTFDQYRPADRKVIEGEIQKAVQSAEALGMDPNDVPKVKELREQLANYSVDTGALENEVYSHLYGFFRRYYDNGDFISMRRYKEGVYAIPYEGEEVKLHWANADQYYVKTTENFRDYTFRLPSNRLAHFKIVEAETEKDNVKAPEEKDRRFILAAEDAVTVEDGALVIRFEYRTDSEKRRQKDLNTFNAQAVLTAAPADWQVDLLTLTPSESSPNRTLLDKHLADYSARNTFDYFIHKDLRGFLNRELDFYIKNEIMRLDDIEDAGASRVEQYLSKIKVVRTIAHKIIDFLAQIEDFQKKLWLKKKFVVETNYCITLDRVPEELYPEICTNDAQREEWVRLFAIDEITGEQPAQPELGATPKPGYSVPLTVGFLKANPFLVLDTKFFSKDFLEKQLNSMTGIFRQCEGLLIHSENYQALGILQSQYIGQIKSIYIDPPYNAKSSEILYKNTFKHSSWLSLMENRISLSKQLMSSNGDFVIAIDENEQEVLGKLIDLLFPEYQKTCVTIVHNPSGQQGDNFSYCHDFAYFIYPYGGRNIGFEIRDEEAADTRNFRDVTGDESLRTAAANCFYPILIKSGQIIGFGDVCDDNFHPGSVNTICDDGVIEVYPVDPQGIERKWRFARQTVESIKNELFATQIQRRNIWDIKRTKNEFNFKTVWTDSKYSANNHGTQLLNQIMGAAVFTFPKSLFTVRDSILASTNGDKNSVVLDYFAGSGTTGHAVIDLNRSDEGFRKYVLIEMGAYFDTATKPRIEKVIYSKDWTNGKPISREGSSHCFKYMRLESYEDTLNNLTFRRTQEQELALEANPEFKENYMLSYILDVESKDSLLNIKSFLHPFNYQLNISTGMVGESKPTKIDLVETFNYLIGLHVETIQVIRGFHVVTGKNPEGEPTLVIWRDLEEKSNEDLDNFFRTLVINPSDLEFELIYVNGDNNLENIRRPDETWKVRLIEEEFVRLMFEEK